MEHPVLADLPDARGHGGRPFLVRRLRDSGRLRAEAEVARAWGVPPSRLHGREPRQVTTYEYDEQNRLVRSVTVREREWTVTDLAEATALLKLEADTCPGCGEALSESTDPKADGGYHVDDPTRCHACTALHAKQDKYQNGRALFFQVQRTWRGDDPDGGWRYG